MNINLQEKPEWYFETNPLGKVPSLEYNGKIIYESLVCVDYLDETFSSGRPILPKDPYERAKQRMLVERLSGVSADLLLGFLLTLTMARDTFIAALQPLRMAAEPERHSSLRESHRCTEALREASICSLLRRYPPAPVTCSSRISFSFR